jgi:hypothetical protein
MKIKLTIVIGILFLCAANIFAQGGGKAEPNRIKFTKGKSSAALSGTLSNDEQMEYVFGAKAGQKITLKVTSAPKGNFFDFELSGDGFEFQTENDSYSDYSFTAPETGDYLVYVRKRPTENIKKAKFFLTLTIK